MTSLAKKTAGTLKAGGQTAAARVADNFVGTAGAGPPAVSADSETMGDVSSGVPRNVATVSGVT